jgi:23S rRNA (cytidine1920-2'-O)/16S rRNA (cytidine1409-2'-O)-methyltransferase
VLDVAAAAGELGLGVAGVTASPLPGPSGNVEFFVWFRRDARPPTRTVRAWSPPAVRRGSSAAGIAGGGS